jgi:PAS domain S-box-containing protein
VAHAPPFHRRRELASLFLMGGADVTRTVIGLVHQPIAVLDRDHRIVHASPAFTALGLDLAKLHDAITTGEKHEFVHGWRLFELQARPLGDEIVVLVEDMAAHVLRNYEYLVGAITDTVFSADRQWRILTWNAAAERFLGYTAAEAIGRPSPEVIHLDDDMDRTKLRQQLTSGQVVTVHEARIRHKSGEWREMSSSTVPIRDDAGQPLGYVCVMHDIREAKALERQLREHARVVEEANKELDSFTYSVSHDLRAPLRAIDGFSRILVEEHGSRMSKEEQRLLQVIRKNTLQMGQLIDDLLSFARLGRKELSMTPIDMKELIIELVPEVLAGTEERLIDLRAGFVPPCVGDRALLKQVWLNLLSNAVKYTRKREHAVIQISGEVTDSELVYKVQDNGAGFSMQYADKLFGVFQRLHRSSEFEGTGVGLALVHRIVRRHKGRVWAEGTPDVGATFWFALPRGEQ